MTLNIMTFDKYQAVIQYDDELNMFRGEFVGLNGGGDFYATDIEGLRYEGQQTLDVFLELCAEKGIDPIKRLSGKFNVRIPPKLHSLAVLHAQAENKSLNQWVMEAVEARVSS